MHVVSVDRQDGDVRLVEPVRHRDCARPNAGVGPQRRRQLAAPGRHDGFVAGAHFLDPSVQDRRTPNALTRETATVPDGDLNPQPSADGSSDVLALRRPGEVDDDCVGQMASSPAGRATSNRLRIIEMEQ